MNTHLERARVLVIVLIVGVCFYFFNDLKNFEVSLETRFEMLLMLKHYACDISFTVKSLFLLLLLNVT